MPAHLERRRIMDVDASERPLKELVTDVGRDIRTLVRQELALAKAEVREKASQAARAGVSFGGATVLAHTGALALVATIVLGLVALGVVAWLAALATALVVLGAAAGLVWRGRRALTGNGGLAPRRTVETTRETVRWVKEDVL